MCASEWMEKRADGKWVCHNESFKRLGLILTGSVIYTVRFRKKLGFKNTKAKPKCTPHFYCWSHTLGVCCCVTTAQGEHLFILSWLNIEAKSADGLGEVGRSTLQMGKVMVRTLPRTSHNPNTTTTHINQHEPPLSTLRQLHPLSLHRQSKAAHK